MARSRLRTSLINVSTTAVVFVSTMILSMLVRMCLTRTLGDSYVGLNGVLTSVVTSFSLADLGIDSVFVYLLYKPIANHNTEEVNGLMLLFKKIYIVIGSIFILIGLIAVPWLKHLLGEQAMDVPNIYIIYLLFMLNTGLSYFFSYYRILLTADQNYYMIARITFLVTVFTDFLQIILLVFAKQFLVYVLILLLNTLLTNFIIAFIVRQRYKYIIDERLISSKLDSSVMKTLIKNTVGGLSNKLGTIIVFSSDNILLANFVGLSAVGAYSNYTLVTQGISSFISKILSSLTATIGNLGTENDKKRNLNIYLQISFAMNFLIILIALPLLLVFSLFIKIWVGSSNVLPVISVILIVVSTMLQLMRYPSLTFIDAFGLQWIQKWKSVVEAGVNLIVSLVLLTVFKLGLNGVLFGTLVSSIFVVGWYEPYIVLREVADRQYGPYIKQTSKFIIILLCEFLLANLLLSLPFFQIFTLNLLLVIIGIFLFMVLMFGLMFSHNPYFQFYISLIGRYIHK